MNCVKCRREVPEDAVYCPYCGRKQAQERKPVRRAGGTGTVYRQSGRRRKPWVARKNGVYIGTYETKKEALTALEKLSGQNLSERYNMTFEQVYQAWSAEHFPTLTDSGRASYCQSYKVFSPLHNRKFRELRTADFQAAIDGIDRKRATLAKYKQLITQMSSWAMREEIIQTNFASFVRLPKEEKREKEIFTDEEIRLLEEDGSEAARVVLMLIYTGMRLGELFALPVADYHGTYCIGGGKTEAGRDRIIPIRPAGRCHFEYFAAQATGELLLSGYVGQHVPANFRNRDYYPLLARLGIRKLTPHATRHTFASWAVRAGMQPEILQKILGHADYSTTADIYVHADIDQLVDAVSV